MNEIKISLFGFLMLLCLIGMSEDLFAQADWVHFDTNNKLVYKTDSKGNRVMDFSSAGYMGGGVSLPTIPVLKTLSAGTGDQTKIIQEAINQVSALPLVNGFRGAVLLNPGMYNIDTTITISSSGVVLRGSGSGTGGTILNMTDTSGFLAINILGKGSYSTFGSVNITDTYIPSGATSFNVSDASGFVVGGNILISKPVTKAWLKYLGMDTLFRYGKPETWIAVGSTLKTDRIITAINGRTITIDAPLTDNFDSRYLGDTIGTVANYTFNGRISQCGVENLQILAPKGTKIYGAIDMNNIIDSWINNVTGQETQNCFVIEKNAKRITLEKVTSNISVLQTNPAPTTPFILTGTQILLNKCGSNSFSTFQVSTGGEGTGPIVVLYHNSTVGGSFQPHMRWTTGILVDNGTFSGKDGIDVVYRGTDGSGHGWTTAWTVAWNCKSSSFVMTEAPGTINWVIGGKGTRTSQKGIPDGIYDDFNTNVCPQSLYLQQLYERLGQTALSNIGYSNMCTSSITAASTSFCTGQSTVLTASPGTAYAWYNGTAMVDTTATYIVTAAGSYTQKVTNPGGCVVTSAPTVITVKALPVAPTVISPLSYCQNYKALALTATGTELKWYTLATGGTGSTSAPIPSASTVGTTNYYVSQTTTGCEGSRAVITVTVSAIPSAIINASGPTTFCKGASVVLSAPSVSGQTYQWYSGTTAISGQTSESYKASTTGSYSVQVINASSCSATSTAQTVTVNALPTAAVTPNGDTTFCPGSNVTLNANAGTGFTYQWYKGTAPINGQTISSYTAMNSGSYAVMITDGNSCSSMSKAILVTAACTTTGIVSLNKNTEIQVWPNPFRTELNLSVPSESEIEVVDLRGRLVYQGKEVSILNLGELSSGIYILRITTSEGTSIVKVEKE